MKRILPVVSLLVGLLGALSSAAQEAGPGDSGKSLFQLFKEVAG